MTVAVAVDVNAVIVAAVVMMSVFVLLLRWERAKRATLLLSIINI